MSQIIKKFIGNDQVGAAKILLENNSALRARNAADSADVNMFKLDSADIIAQMADMIPSSDASLDLGSSAARYAKAYAQEVLSGSGNLSVDSAAVLNLKAVTNVVINADLLPDVTETSDLGSSSKKFADGYIKTLYSDQIANVAGNTAVSGANVILGSSTAVIISAEKPLQFANAAGTSAISFQVPASFTATSYKWPSADGSADYVLKTDGAGNMAWSAVSSLGSFANKTLSNLDSPTALNQDLLPGADNTRDLGSSSYRFAEAHALKVVNASGNLALEAGAASYISMNKNLVGLDATAFSVVSADAADSAIMNLKSGDGSNTTGAINIQSGNHSGSGQTGDVNILTGTTGGGNSRGNVYVESRNLIMNPAQTVMLYNNKPLRFVDDQNTSAYVGFKCPTSVVSSIDYVLPNADGTDGQYLKTNGSGVMSWASLPTAAIWDRESITLAAGDITNGYVDLAHQAVSDSIIFFVDGVMMRFGVDYTVSVVGGVTRLDFSTSVPPMASGDVLYIQYQY